MTKLILVRHGHVEGISPERFRGRAELPLTETGRREAAATAVRIAANWRPAAIYTSPMGRCVETGAAIGKPLSLSGSVMPGVNDIDYGDWQGLTNDEARASWPDELETWYRHPDWAAIPRGETLAAGPHPQRRGVARGGAASSGRHRGDSRA
jgi:phosphoserine phosphatase